MRVVFYSGGQTHGSAPTFDIGLSFMHWVFIDCNLTVTSAVPLRFFLAGAGFLLLCLILVMVGLTVSHFAKGRRGVKFILSFEASSRSCEEYSSDSAVLSRCIRKASRMYETLRTDEGFSGEDFQNTGTFIVVRSSVFSKSSVQKTHLARDAHDAFLRWASGCQVRYFQLLCGRFQDPEVPRFITGNEKRLRAMCPESFKDESAQERIRTSTGLPPLAPQASASAIPPLGLVFESDLLAYTNDRKLTQSRGFPSITIRGRPSRELDGILGVKIRGFWEMHVQ